MDEGAGDSFDGEGVGDEGTVSVLPPLTKVTQAQIDNAYAAADQKIASGLLKPSFKGKQARDAKMTTILPCPRMPR
jgi:hypothetical protein